MTNFGTRDQETDFFVESLAVSPSGDTVRFGTGDRNDNNGGKTTDVYNFRHVVRMKGKRLHNYGWVEETTGRSNDGNNERRRKEGRIHDFERSPS